MDHLLGSDPLLKARLALRFGSAGPPGAGASTGHALSCTGGFSAVFCHLDGAGIMFSTAVGALVGGRLLRW